MGEKGKRGKGEKEVKENFQIVCCPFRLFAFYPFPPFSPQPLSSWL